jgi:hypothetical protein
MSSSVEVELEWSPDGATEARIGVARSAPGAQAHTICHCCPLRGTCGQREHDRDDREQAAPRAERRDGARQQSSDIERADVRLSVLTDKQIRED